MLPSSQSSLPIPHAYRHLYRALLRAVQYSTPNRYVARDQLRDAFCRGHYEQFDKQKISRTLEFLDAATRERGLEHRLLKNLLHVAYWRILNLKKLVSQSLCGLFLVYIYGSQSSFSQSFMEVSNISIRQQNYPVSGKTSLPGYLRTTARTNYDMTVAMLNDSMGLCLR